MRVVLDELLSLDPASVRAAGSRALAESPVPFRLRNAFVLGSILARA